MDKKNTMLLTVIAVATLLVAVVGATFAYFSVTGNKTSNTAVTGSTPNVGVVAVANKTSGLYLKPTIEQLQDKSGKTYYGISTDGDAVEDAGTTYFEIATIGATTGTAKYNCTADLIVDVSEDTGMVTALKDGEVFVKFEANEAITSGYPESPVDLHKDTTSDGKKTFNLEFDLTGTTPVSIKAQSYFVNSSSEDRTLGLAGKTLNAKITIDNLSCTVTD